MSGPRNKELDTVETTLAQVVANINELRGAIVNNELSSPSPVIIRNAERIAFSLDIAVTESLKGLWTCLQ